MANLRLYPTERIRITADYKDNSFIDVSGHKDELGMSIELYPTMQYIEIRKKGGVLRQFIFEKKGHKKYYDFGYWGDAEVIFSINEVHHTP